MAEQIREEVTFLSQTAPIIYKSSPLSPPSLSISSPTPPLSLLNHHHNHLSHHHHYLHHFEHHHHHRNHHYLYSSESISNLLLLFPGVWTVGRCLRLKTSFTSFYFYNIVIFVLIGGVIEIQLNILKEERVLALHRQTSLSWTYPSQ